MNWQPIATAPKDGSWVIVTSTWNQYHRAVVQWDGEAWIDVNESNETDMMQKSATHWMPFPAQPDAND